MTSVTTFIFAFVRRVFEVILSAGALGVASAVAAILFAFADPLAALTLVPDSFGLSVTLASIAVQHNVPILLAFPALSLLTLALVWFIPKRFSFWLARVAAGAAIFFCYLMAFGGLLRGLGVEFEVNG